MNLALMKNVVGIGLALAAQYGIAQTPGLREDAAGVETRGAMVAECLNDEYGLKLEFFHQQGTDKYQVNDPMSPGNNHSDYVLSVENGSENDSQYLILRWTFAVATGRAAEVFDRYRIAKEAGVQSYYDAGYIRRDNGEAEYDDKDAKLSCTLK